MGVKEADGSKNRNVMLLKIEICKVYGSQGSRLVSENAQGMRVTAFKVTP